MNQIWLGDDNKKHEFTNLVGDLSDTFPRRTAAQITGIAVHHDAAFFDGADKNFNGTTVDEELQRIRAVHALHTQTNGWGGIAYHIYVFPSGRLWHVGDLLTIRAHVFHRNTPLVGVVLAGDFTHRVPQLGSQLGCANAIDAVNRQLKKALPYEAHKNWAVPASPTACCGDSWDRWKTVPAVVIEAIANEVN